MKALFVLNGHKYVTKFLVPVAEELKKNDITVDLFLPHESEKEHRNQEIFAEVNFFNFKRLNLNFFSIFKSLKDFIFIDLEKYKYVHVVSTKVIIFFLIGLLLSPYRYKNKIIILHFIGLGRLFGNKGMIGFFLRQTTKLISILISKKNFFKIIFLNESDKKILKNIFNEKFFSFSKVPGAGVNLNEYFFVKRKIKSKIKILFLGRLIPQKGLDLFIQICNKLIKEYKLNLSAEIVGSFEDLDYENRIIKLIEKKNIKNISLVGETEKPFLHYESSDFLIFPSSYGEGVPTVVLEAMATGLPCIVSDLPGCKEIIDDDINGYLMSNFSIDDWCKKLIFLINNPLKYKNISYEGRRKVENNFKVQKLAFDTLRLYQE